MRGWLDTLELELGDLPHSLEDCGQLALEALDLALRNLEARKARYMQYVIACNCHETSV